MTDKEWQDRVKGRLKAELSKRNINYVQLAEMLKDANGSAESSQNLSNKIVRGKFSAIFLVQVCDVLGCDNIKLN